MSYSKTINWLIKKVNELLDNRCGCDSCSGGIGGAFPNVALSFGEGDNGDVLNRVFFRRDGFLEDEKTAYLNPVTVDKLIVDIKEEDWLAIADYEPTLLIDRWSPKKKIKNGLPRYRKGGYKHETQYHANFNGRVNELLLTGNRSIIDPKVEEYFKVDSGQPLIKGIGDKYSGSAKFTEGLTPFVYTHLGFRLRLTIDGEIKESNIFTHLKLTFYNTDIGDAGETYQGLVRFSWA